MAQKSRKPGEERRSDIAKPFDPHFGQTKPFDDMLLGSLIESSPAPATATKGQTGARDR
ncbi:hypothetical protein BIWAKO_03391 [Bosea sp. BIWAKO-01]|nr:hypothetical protein BIWAKO_03391 [Bosea sp. BIWAKO-01]